MYERFPISSIHESYRPVPETRTVVMPLLITLTGVGLLTFYIKTRPEVVHPLEPIVAVPARIAEPSPPVLRANPVAMVEPETQVTSLPLLDRDGVTAEDFTPWMSPLALDTYIRQRNRGFEKNFWERGHWIKAVEGRWNNGTHEFRISIAANPDPERIQWYYQIDQTEAQFAETLSRLRNEGYTLAQSHAYERPDGTMRFQGVWQRIISDSGTTQGNEDFIGAATRLRQSSLQ